MYVPPHFAPKDESFARDFLSEYSFATVVCTNHVGVPIATQLPVLHDAKRNVLRSHIARANPQSEYLKGRSDVLVIFHGPHCFVSSRWYEQPVNVSTWNYSAVQIYGTVTVVSDENDVLQFLRDLNHSYDGAEGEEHFRRLPTDYVQALIGAILVFEVEISEVQTKLKMSQNLSSRDRRSVIEHLERRTDSASHDVAALMKMLYPDEGSWV